MAIARTVSMRAPRRAQKESSMVPVVVGAAVAGGLAWWLMRPSSSTSASSTMIPKLPSTVGGSPPVTVLNPPPVSGYYSGTGNTQTAGTSGQNGPDPSFALVQRLQGSTQAQKIFALQAMAYSYNATDAIPDGIEGPVTDAIISRLAGENSYTSDTLGRVQSSLAPQIAIGQPRLLPYTLPTYLIDMVNQTAQSVAPGSPLLQVLPQIPNASGQVMPYAGYSRVASNAPSNSVGGQPGYGVVTDPEGMNIGIWQSLYGGGRRGPSGNIAADLNINPVAGQDGSYAAGFPNRYGRYEW